MLLSLLSEDRARTSWGRGAILTNHTRLVCLAALAVMLWCAAGVTAAPTTATQAQNAVTGWLKVSRTPLGTALGGQIARVDTFTAEAGEPVYYVLYLEPSGFVVVPADDRVEPIIAFVEHGTYDPSPDNPLGALVSRDLPSRIAAVRDPQATARAQTAESHLLDRRKALEKAGLEAQSKWAELQDYVDMVQAMGLSDISDVWVAPLVQSQWSQTMAWGDYCYNYYTPNHYPCGCVATAMAQVMRYYEHPSEGIGVHTFTITVDGNSQDANTRGGDGAGGPYNWSDMLPQPEPNITLPQRQAIGALCYDAGVSANMKYASSESCASIGSASSALKGVFGYSNTVHGCGIPWGLWNDRINPSLDAGCPVILGITGVGGSHAIVCDGYGYDLDTRYHHINMGWGGASDAWYNLPDVGSYHAIEGYVHNIFRTGSGEIISGRVTTEAGIPMSGVTVSADTGSQIYDVNTNDKGIYALSKVPANTTFTVSASKNGYTLVPQRVTTGYSDYYNAGSKWGIDLEGVSGSHPVIWLSVEELEFTAVEGGANPDPQILSIWNCGFETLNWMITCDCNWLQVEPNAGSSTGEPNEVTFNVDTTNLSHGSYHCELTVTDPCALNSPKAAQVTLYVTNELYVPDQYPTIQAAIDAAAHGCTVIVAPGLYTGQGNRDLDFMGKRLTVRSSDPNDPNVVSTTIIDCNGTEAEQHRAFYFHSSEDANSILAGFTITNGYLADFGAGICCDGSSPTISNCVLVGNTASGGGAGGALACLGSRATIINCVIVGNRAEGADGFVFNGSGGGICCLDGEPNIINCTISGNKASKHGGGIFCMESTPAVINSILWGNAPQQIYFFNGTPLVGYSAIEDGFSGAGNIDLNPCFADPGFWHPNDTPNDANDDFWVGGDYHLRSQAGRCDPNEECWIVDANTSPAVDAGDPNSSWTAELWPHGKRINIGAYGGTAQASMSLSSEGSVADLNNSGSADYIDLMLFAQEWLCEEFLLSGDLNRNGFVDLPDFAVFANDWLWEE